MPSAVDGLILCRTVHIMTYPRIYSAAPADGEPWEAIFNDLDRLLFPALTHWCVQSARGLMIHTSLLATIMHSRYCDDIGKALTSSRISSRTRPTLLYWENSWLPAST